MIGGSRAIIPSSVWLYIIAFAQDATVAFLLLYFIFVGAEIIRPGVTSLFFDVQDLLYLAGAAVAVLMVAIRYSKLPYITAVQARKYSWVWSFVGSTLLGWFTAWQVRGSTSYAVLIGIVTGLLIFCLSQILMHSEDASSDQE
jgi:hypothetical protein